MNEEANLLIEAVSLLVQRQRDAETSLAKQFRQTALNDAHLQARVADLEERLASIQDRLGSLAQDVDPELAREADMASLRLGVDSLSNGHPDLPARPHAPATFPTSPFPSTSDRVVDLPARSARSAGIPGGTSGPQTSDPPAGGGAAPSPPPPATARSMGQSGGAGVWDLLGSTTQERVGLILMGGGAVAILYTVLRLAGLN